jgi:hypothetical protein|tara:strand:+ start:877 stop:1710 length:834 start_codon:yes stop_codon:yes gene_type:complete
MTFKRPMFRKGGDVGGGIMDTVVDRSQYANGPEDPNKDLMSIRDKVDFIESIGGGDQLADPLTQFLLSYGPAVATQTGGGSTIGNLVAAAKEPTADLLKNINTQRRARQAIALELFDEDDDEVSALIRKARQVSKDTGRDYKDVLDELYRTEIFRKDKSPTAKKEGEDLTSIQSIIDATTSRTGVPLLDYDQAKTVFKDVGELQKINPEVYDKFLRTRSSDKYIFGSGEYSPEGVILENSVLRSLPDNTYVYDIEKGKFIYKQGNRVFELEEKTEEE